MARSVVTYIADGSTDEFDITFPYISRDHVKVTVNNAQPMMPHRWVSDGRIKLAFTPVKNSVVEIRRHTPLDTRLVDFQNGSVLTEEELDKAINQVFYVQQELKDLYDGALGKALIKVANNGGVTTFPPEYLLDELVNELLEKDVVAELRRRIAEIDLNAETILKQANRLNALQGVVDQLTGQVIGDNGLASFLIQEQQERIEGDAAILASLSLMGAKSEDGTAWILDMDNVRLSPTESLASRLSGIAARLDNADALIVAEQKARADALGAEALRIDSLYTRMEAAEAAIVQEVSARTSAVQAEATQRQALAARVAQAESAIQQEAQVRANETGALTSILSILGAKTADGNAFALDETKLLVSGGLSLGNRLSGIDARLGQNAAAIASEQTARQSQYNSLAQQITQAQSSLNGVINNVSVLQQSVNGIYGRYAVKIDQSTNAVAGIELIGGQSVMSTFRVVANLFELVTPGTSFRPFYVENGVTYIENAVIKNGSMTDIGTYFANLNGRSWSGYSYWVWYDLTDQWGRPVAATVNSNGATAGRCVIDFTWVASRNGGDDDNLGLRIVRSDGTVLAGQLDNVQIDKGKRTYTAKFYDPAVPANTTVTYRVQHQSQGDGFSNWYNVALVATLYKK